VLGVWLLHHTRPVPQRSSSLRHFYIDLGPKSSTPRENRAGKERPKPILSTVAWVSLQHNMESFVQNGTSSLIEEWENGEWPMANNAELVRLDGWTLSIADYPDITTICADTRLTHQQMDLMTLRLRFYGFGGTDDGCPIKQVNAKTRSIRDTILGISLQNVMTVLLNLPPADLGNQPDWLTAVCGMLRGSWRPFL
jgi:hypothetical protein